LAAGSVVVAAENIVMDPADDVGSDHVVVEDCFDLFIGRLRMRGVAGAADEADFFACEGDEDVGFAEAVLATVVPFPVEPLGTGDSSTEHPLAASTAVKAIILTRIGLSLQVPNPDLKY